MGEQSPLAKIMGDFFGTGAKEAIKAILGLRSVPEKMTAAMAKEYFDVAVVKYLRNYNWKKLGVFFAKNPALKRRAASGAVVQILRGLALARAAVVLASAARLGVAALAIALIAGIAGVMLVRNMKNSDARIERGQRVVDPSMDLEELEKLPGINPDFVAATKADRLVASQAASDPRWLRYTTSRYPDGTFILPFEPCRGIDIPNPFTGGLIASSTAECESRRSKK